MSFFSGLGQDLHLTKHHDETMLTSRRNSTPDNQVGSPKCSSPVSKRDLFQMFESMQKITCESTEKLVTALVTSLARFTLLT